MHVISKSSINRVFPTGKSKEDKPSNSSVNRKNSGATASTVGTYESTYEESNTRKHTKIPEAKVSPTSAYSNSNKTSSPSVNSSSPSMKSTSNNSHKTPYPSKSAVTPTRSNSTSVSSNSNSTSTYQQKNTTEPTPPSIDIGDAKGANYKETRSVGHKKGSSSDLTFQKSNQQEHTTSSRSSDPPSVSGGKHDDDASKANRSVDLIDAIAKRASVTDTVASPASKTQDPPGSRAIPVTIVLGEDKQEGEEDYSCSKATLTMDGEESASRSSTAAKEEAQFFYQEQYGLDGNPNEEHKRPTFDVERRSAQALCYAMGCGGVYTEDQVEWITGLFRSKGYDNMIVEAVPALLKQSSDLLDLELVVESKKLMTDDMKSGATLLVYDMYRCASVADWPQEQMCAIAMIAEEIGVGNFGQLEGIKKQVEAEIQLKEARIKLLFPEGHPQLDEQYEKLVGNKNSGDDNSHTKTNDPPMMDSSNSRLGEQQSERKPVSRTSSRDHPSHQSSNAKSSTSSKSNGSARSNNSGVENNNSSSRLVNNDHRDSKATRNPVPRTSSRDTPSRSRSSNNGRK